MHRDIANGRDITLAKVRRTHPNISFPRNPDDDTLAALGYARIHPTPRPSGDVVTQGQPEQREDGKWYQTWKVRDFTAEEQAERLDQAKTQQRRQIEDALAAAIAEGLPYTMPDGTDDVIQMRVEDRQNLLGLAVEARDLQAVGETGAVQELRALSNTRYPMTPGEMIAATDAALAHFKTLMARSWDRKDAIAAVVLEDYPSAQEAIAAVEAVGWAKRESALHS
ncbi:DUF4376 domain-containing protein [Chromohalobacter salexigens]|nr:DUF4376 domain-containing protein [Chromohalobacter salexigens]